MSRPIHSTPSILTVRAALILGLSLMFAGIAGILTFWATRSIPGGILGAGAVAGGAIGLLNQIISSPPSDVE